MNPPADNREPIREVLADYLPPAGLVLEIASGTGDHAVHMARNFPALAWQPSERDTAAVSRLAAVVAEAALENLRPPIVLDPVGARWPIDAADALVCIGLLHVAPWHAAVGLFAGAGRVLSTAGVLVTHGPYRIDGMFTAAANEQLDHALTASNPEWGVRDVAHLEGAALDAGLVLELIVAMPGNNHALVFRRR